MCSSDLFYPAIFEKQTLYDLSCAEDPQDKLWFNALLDGLDFPTTLDDEQLAQLPVPAFINTAFQ